MRYMWSEVWDRRDYLGYDIFSMSLSRPFSWYPFFFKLDSPSVGVFEKV